MAYSVTISISVTKGKLYKISSTATADMYYSGTKVFGSGASVYFVANDSTQLIIQSTGAITGSVNVTEILRSFYDTNDSQGCTWVFSSYVNKWICQHSFIPESMSMASNRFVSFYGGNIYMHDSTAYNTFYGVVYDSVIAFAHNEAGNTVKSYDSIAVEGSVPDRVHVRTESPYVQSSDLISGDFKSLEGVWYASLFRDRLSPNTGSSDYVTNLYKGDKVRGEVAKFQVVYSQPTTKKEFKFFNVNFDPSRGQSV